MFVRVCSYLEGETFVDGIMYDLEREEFVSMKSGKPFQTNKIEVGKDRKTYSSSRLMNETNRQLVRYVRDNAPEVFRDKSVGGSTDRASVFSMDTGEQVWEVAE